MLRFPIYVFIGVLTLKLVQGNDYGDISDDETVGAIHEKSGYGDVLSGEDETDENKMVNTENNDDDSIPELQSQLNLSGYELMAIVDILMEISARPCPQTNVRMMTQIKKYLAFGLRHAPKTRNEHPLFFPNFMKLVECLDQAAETYPEFRKLLVAPIESYGHVDATSTLSDATVPTTESALSSTEAESNRANVPQEETLYQSTSPERLQNSPIAPSIVGKYMSPINESLSFERLFALLISIKDKTCKQEESEDHTSFLISSLVQVLHFAANDSNLYKSAQLKYFHSSSVLSELELCEKSDVFSILDL